MPAAVASDIRHGTRRGYRQGCRDEECPAPEGVSCREAMNRYSRRWESRRQEAGYEQRSGLELEPGLRPYETTASHVRIGYHVELVRYFIADDRWQSETVLGKYRGVTPTHWRVEGVDGVERFFPRGVWEVCER